MAGFFHKIKDKNYFTVAFHEKLCQFPVLHRCRSGLLIGVDEHAAVDNSRRASCQNMLSRWSVRGLQRLSLTGYVYCPGAPGSLMPHSLRLTIVCSFHMLWGTCTI
jgi:hypothetical protein